MVEVRRLGARARAASGKGNKAETGRPVSLGGKSHQSWDESVA